ncbi:MAG: hypothetical protein EPN88_17545 [Bacteroidetes bacterium]|nr:MAG: hypothetical protein EPN88_17545 [Bacteroidota bacterium]
MKDYIIDHPDEFTKYKEEFIAVTLYDEEGKQKVRVVDKDPDRMKLALRLEGKFEDIIVFVTSLEEIRNLRLYEMPSPLIGGNR